MKKLMAAIAMLLAVVPFVNVNALNEETTNFYTYKKGQVVNFYANSAREAARNSEATEAIILNDKGADAKFVKAWIVVGFSLGTDTPPIYFDEDDGVFDFRHPMPEQSPSAYDWVINGLSTLGYEDGDENSKNNYFYTFSDTTKGIDLLTLQELIDVFGATRDTATGNYVVPNNTYIDRDGVEITLYDELEKMIAIEDTTTYNNYKNGMWTGTVADEDQQKVWCIKFTVDETTHQLTKVTVEPEKVGVAGKTYSYAITAYANKTADCHEAPTVGEHCYKCKKTAEGQFEWVILKDNDSKVGDVCELEADTAKCNPKTGSKSHLLEFSIVAALCAISLLVVRRKDLFRTM